MPITLLDPTGELGSIARVRAPRLPALAGQVIALLDISKPRGDVFLDRLTTLVTERGATVRRYTKPTFTKPAPSDLQRRIAEDCTAVIEALAD